MSYLPIRQFLPCVEMKRSFFFDHPREKRALPHKHHRPSKLASKIRGKKKTESASSAMNELDAPFHKGVLPSQYNMEQSELEKVGRQKRRKEW